MQKRIVLIATLIAGAAVLSGCKSECEKFYDMMVECAGKDDAPSKDDFLKECEKEREKADEEDKAMLACGAESSCGEFEGCVKKVAEARSKKLEEKFAAEDIAEVQKAIDEAKFDQRPTPCYGLDGPDANEKLVEICKQYSAKGHEHLTAVMTKARDERTKDENIWSRCSDLETYAEAVSPEAKAAATVLCEEAKLADDLNKTTEAVKAAVEAKTAEIPFECGLTLDYLAKIDSDWAKTTTRQIAEACYLELGQIVLDAKVPDMQYSCDYNVSKVYEAAKKYALSKPEFDAQIEKAKALCEKTE